MAADVKSTVAMTTDPIAYVMNHTPKESADYPLLLLGDTEGKQYLHQISLKSLGDGGGIDLSCDLVIPARLRNGVSAEVISSAEKKMTLQEFWAELDKQTKGHDKVYILMHNGRAHDETLLKMTAAEEKFVIGPRYHFGDSLEIFRHWIQRSTIATFGLETIYRSIFGPTHCHYSFHTAVNDAYYLRKLFRFLVMYMIKRADYPNKDISLSDAAKTGWIKHDDPLCERKATHVLFQWLQAKLFEWRTFSKIRVSKPKPQRDGSLATYASAASPSKRHYPDCRLVRKHGLIHYDDASILEKLPICQLCAAIPPSMSIEQMMDSLKISNDDGEEA